MCSSDLVYGESADGRRARSGLRHPPPPADAERSAWRFRAADLDVAGHVNNAAYLEPVEELYVGDAEPDSADLEVEFREPATAGEAHVLRHGSAMWIAAPGGAVRASILGLPPTEPRDVDARDVA